MDLQRFVTEVFETLGGMVIPLEYGLCQVLIPEVFRESFQGKSEVLLAFDYEVAQENPGAEFVTFGSYILDKVIETATANAVSTLRYGVLPGLTLSNPEQKISQSFHINPGSIEISNFRTVMGLWSAFCFRIGYTSEERVEEIREIWIDLLTGKRTTEMEKLKSSVFYESNSSYPFPLACMPDFSAAFTEAYQEAENIAKSNKLIHLNSREMESELRRIDEYYDELEVENQKNMERRGISEERLETLKAKGHTLRLDRQKQRSEMIDKFSIKTDITLDYGVTYLIPRLEYNVLVRNHDQTVGKTIYYNFITKEFEDLTGSSPEQSKA